MGQIHEPAPVLLIVAATSRHDTACDWARQRCTDRYGRVVLVSKPFDFSETDYYAATMGPGLKKQFLAFESLVDPSSLASIKIETNGWESQYAALGQHAEPRPLNLDPGYITPAKLVLASTKDHAHRLYLRDGIYAELTLVFTRRQWRPLEWTYPDYRRQDYQLFFTQCREWLLNCGASATGVK